MSQFAGDDTMSILDSINDGKHFVPKDTEPKPSMGWKKILAICAVAAVLAITVHILAVNSMSFAMLSNGINPSSVTYITRNAGPANGNRISVFHAEITDGTPALVYARENTFGFWSIDDLASVTEEQPWAYMWWKEYVSDEWLDRYDRHNRSVCYQLVFIGEDAVSDIIVDSIFLPSDTAVYITQRENSYLIRMISFDEKLTKVPVREILEENGCVSVSGQVDANAEKKTVMLASWSQGYGSIKDLTADSDLIALIEIEDVASYGISQDLPHTVFAAKVLEPVHNAQKDEEIRIYMTGGQMGGETVEIADDPLMKSGEQYLVFCRENSDGTYTILGGPQGRFVYDNGKLSSLDVAYGWGESSGIQAKLDHADANAIIKEIKQYLPK